MAKVKPFLCIRPEASVASRVAALPYDVYNRQEAKAEVEREPLSFLKIDRAETQFPDSTDMYAEEVYAKAKELLDKVILDGTYLTEEKEYYFIYELVMNERSQTGIVACASIDDYLNNVIKKHENTREDKEIDRIHHVDTCNAQTGPIFLAYRAKKEINEIVSKVKKEKPLYDFTAVDGISHHVWKVVNSSDIEIIQDAFAKLDTIYIADGHHRAASAVKVGLKRRKDCKEYDGTEEFNYFLSVLFPDEELKIFDYNRVVKDLNGYSKEEFLEKIRENFIVTKKGAECFRPEKKAQFGMYLDNMWYSLEAKEHLLEITDPVDSLDVSLLQDYLLEPVLGIMILEPIAELILWVVFEDFPN